jgi:hypothetical protein
MRDLVIPSLIAGLGTSVSQTVSGMEVYAGEAQD